MKETKEELKQLTAKVVSNVLENQLKRDANSASCAFLYQPKEPKGLERYKK